MKTESTSHILEFGARRIPYSLHWMDRKSLRIIVSPNLSVDVYAPLNVTEAEVCEAVRKRAPWICRSLDQVSEFHPLPSPKHFVSGETFVYLGRQYRLRVGEEPKTSARLYGRFLEVRVPDKTTKRGAERAVKEWFAVRAAAIFSVHAAKCQEIGSRHGIPAAKFLIRKMRTRWGSCTASGHITLNVDLVQAPVHCIDYVIMHELCHLVHHNHSRAFYRLLNRCMPDWEQRKRILHQIALTNDAKVDPGRSPHDRD